MANKDLNRLKLVLVEQKKTAKQTRHPSISVLNNKKLITKVSQVKIHKRDLT